jgi:hypothetical protein
LPRPHFVSSSHLFFLQKKCAILILLSGIGGGIGSGAGIGSGGGGGIIF